MPPSARTLFITGTNTGVGKTVLATALVRELKRAGEDVWAVKPWCSGGRADARALGEALGDSVDLEAINPWHFREALSPAIAARRHGSPLLRKDALAFLREARRRAEWLVIEGAGGLLSPLGEDFDARDLIHALKAVPLVVAANQLGAINQVRLVLDALGPATKRAWVFLMQPRRDSTVMRTNVEELRSRKGGARVVVVPFLTASRPRPEILGEVVDGWRRGV